MSGVLFTCTSLKGTNKEGVIKPDASGYRTMVVGGLNVFNSAGQYYEYEGAKALFENSSQFMRRVSRGSLKGEMGHPRQERNQSNDDFINRILEIRESNVCVHFKEIFLDFNNIKDEQGKPIIAIMAKLIPSGPLGDCLEKSLQNPSENVCFSIRSFTMDKMNRGIVTRTIKNIVTFDNVTEPGISIANKYKAPGLESNVDKIITKSQFERAFKDIKPGMGIESSKMNPDELFESFGWIRPESTKPSFANW
jgi:Peptidase S80 family